MPPDLTLRIVVILLVVFAAQVVILRWVFMVKRMWRLLRSIDRSLAMAPWMRTQEIRIQGANPAKRVTP